MNGISLSDRNFEELYVWPPRQPNPIVLLTIALAFIAFIVGFSAPLSRPMAMPSEVPILDAHTHIIGGKNNAFFNEAVAAELAEMRRYHISKSIVMSPPRGEYYRANFDYPQFIGVIRRYRNRFAFLGGGGLLNPMVHTIKPSAVTPAVKAKFTRLALQILKAGASGFGEMSSLHLSLAPEHGYNFAPADHPLLLLLADIAAARDVPIDLHNDALSKAEPRPARFAGFQDPPVLPATIAPLERLLEHNPKAKIIWDHGGADQLGDMTAQRVGAMMDRYPNLYMSLKPLPPDAPGMNKLFSKQGLDSGWAAVIVRHADRFFIGSDNFYVPNHIRPDKAPVQFSRHNGEKMLAVRAFLTLLPADLAPDIAYANAERLFKLKL
jgi:hypothetical protein